MNKQDQFSEWYKEQFNKLNEEPPVDIWDNISDNLDIEDVWTKVDSKLDVIEKRKALAIRGLFVLSLLLLFFVIGNVFLNIYKYSSKMTSANLGKKSDKTHNSRSLNDNVTTFENRKTEKIKSNISSSSSSSSSKNLTTDLLVKKSSDMSNLPLSKVLSKSLSNGGVDTFSDKTINVLVKHVNQPSQTSNLPSSKVRVNTNNSNNSIDTSSDKLVKALVKPIDQPSQTSNLPSSKVRVNTNNSNNSIDTSSDKLAKALVKQINQPSQINNLSLSKVHENNTTLNNHTDVSSGRAINALVKHGDQFGNIMGDPTNHVSKNTTDFNYTKVKNDSSLFVISPISTIPIPFKPIDSIVSNLEIPSMDESIYYVNPISKFHGFYAGGICSVNNVWLLNQLTFDGLKGNSLSDTKIGMGYSYGISVGYNIVSHWSGEVNWYINSKHGQTYNIYNEGRYTSRELYNY
jgi:hypothetical protein